MGTSAEIEFEKYRSIPPLARISELSGQKDYLVDAGIHKYRTGYSSRPGESHLKKEGFGTVREGSAKPRKNTDL